MLGDIDNFRYNAFGDPKPFLKHCEFVIQNGENKSRVHSYAPMVCIKFCKPYKRFIRIQAKSVRNIESFIFKMLILNLGYTAMHPWLRSILENPTNGSSGLKLNLSETLRVLFTNPKSSIHQWFKFNICEFFIVQGHQKH